MPRRHLRKTAIEGQFNISIALKINTAQCVSFPCSEKLYAHRMLLFVQKYFHKKWSKIVFWLTCIAQVFPFYTFTTSLSGHVIFHGSKTLTCLPNMIIWSIHVRPNFNQNKHFNSMISSANKEAPNLAKHNEMIKEDGLWFQNRNNIRKLQKRSKRFDLWTQNASEK